MLKDRAQKALALKLSLSKRWLPQLEIEVEPSTRVERSKYVLTDVDVLAVVPSAIGGHSRVIFDCKSGARESAIGRAFWLHGVMEKTHSSHGFVFLNQKVSITHDHRISASDLEVSLLHEGEIESLAQCMGGGVEIPDAAMGNIDLWDQFLALGKKYPALEPYHIFSRSSFWMIRDVGEQCRKVVAKLRAIKTELDPEKPEHLAIFGDALCLFLLSLSEMANRLYLVLLRPSSHHEFSSSLLSLLYGGYDNLEIAQRIRKLTSNGSVSSDSPAIFPELDAFEQLVREILQAPQQVLPSSILAREIGFTLMSSKPITDITKDIVWESPYAAKFLLVAAEYLQLASKLPSEFSLHFGETALRASSSALKKSK
ncbi:hypothetical protein [Halomonas sp. E14]|uniref:hypothetical protein n=1 Tax=Halomonas sp. E14 TaxID=3397245 RepID=UPI00403EA70D